ncbi:ABC transporter ATP-binding protein [Pectobacterium versatile]|uniref:ABC transporter ATP-binding protein n=1 Tax=Pectobacterium versatile TaxID=2488639 RepID=UPI000F8DBCE3|nr:MULTISPECIES: ABC transporter ATP-binding protein [Pectobacterium]GKV82036.1 ABC transporter ATP-binding protein [Pectobacterium carotovorum subsp. carotovorum]MCL6373016.1 ABC transporter ATP-binding protein [Pectobacterium atrosepticum]RUR90018.1 lipoprotein-releasing system ATP-binding protein LolD [Pectobacterium versatile]GKX37123.1 ABC transporter ATP-binding protein [Pectobacterium carotovorum subsp. carotovorum]GLX43445.1 ABC transporter ATP-binding protein [Pectobacterium carotovor
MSDERVTDLICLQGISHTYSTGASSQAVLHDISLSIPAGQSCAIVGASGSGKSTLLNIIGLLDQPVSGRLLLAGQDMSQASADDRAIVRNQVIGFVFQSFNLLPRLDALDNVALPLTYRGVSRQAARQAAQVQLARVGLAERTHHRPADLSGGQRQRVAIARALVGEPALLLADEPTGNLDSQTADDIITLLLALNREQGTTLVMVTHDEGMACRMTRRIQVQDGRIHEVNHV